MTQAQQWALENPAAHQAILGQITRQETAFAQQQQQQQQQQQRQMQRQRVAVPQQAVYPALEPQQGPTGRPQPFPPAQQTPLQQMQLQQMQQQQMQQLQMQQAGIFPIPTGLPPSVQQWHMQRAGVPVSGNVPQPLLQPQPRPFQQWHPQATTPQQAQRQEAPQRQAHGGGTAEGPSTVNSDSEPEWLRNYVA